MDYHSRGFTRNGYIKEDKKKTVSIILGVCIWKKNVLATQTKQRYKRQIRIKYIEIQKTCYDVQNYYERYNVNQVLLGHESNST